MTLRRRSALAALTGVLALTTVACGGGGGGQVDTELAADKESAVPVALEVIGPDDRGGSGRGLAGAPLTGDDRSYTYCNYDDWEGVMLVGGHISNFSAATTSYRVDVRVVGKGQNAETKWTSVRVAPGRNESWGFDMWVPEAPSYDCTVTVSRA